jgi:hypothetical protein
MRRRAIETIMRLSTSNGGAANVQGQEPRQRWIDNKHGVSMLRLRCT